MRFVARSGIILESPPPFPPRLLANREKRNEKARNERTVVAGSANAANETPRD